MTLAGGGSQVIPQEIEVVRPPLMLAHGLASSPATWDEFSLLGTSTPYTNDPRFVKVEAIPLDQGESFNGNALRLLAQEGDVRYAESFEGFIRRFRGSHGYAANQLFYVAHSMGGDVLRAAEVSYPARFYSQRNYGLGFVRRAVTLDTPHNGSGWADIVEDLIGAANDVGIFSLRAFSAVQTSYLYLQNLHDANPGLLPFAFIRPDAPLSSDRLQFATTGALNDLRYEGGQRFGMTPIPTHLVAGDILPGEQPDIVVPDAVSRGLRIGRGTINFVNRLCDLAKWLAPRPIRDQIAELSGLSDVERALKFLDIVLRATEGASFVVDSDVIVSVNSQLAGLSRGSAQPQTSMVEGIGFHHLGITGSRDVGGIVGRLLTEPEPSGRFGSIPAAPAARATNLFAGQNRPRVVEVPEAALTLSSTNVAVDSLLTVQVVVPDTVGLADVRIYVQGNGVTSTTRGFNHSFIVQVGPDALGSQLVEAYAFYDYGDSTAVATDSASIVVTPTATLQDVVAEVNQFQLGLGDELTFPLEALFATYVAPMGLGSPGVSVSIEDGSVLSPGEPASLLQAVGYGGTRVFVSYGGITDTVYVSVGVPGQTDGSVTQSVVVESGWNLLSVPVATSDPTPTTLFPEAASDFFGYTDGEGYTTAATLEPGAGYWARFSEPASYSLSGTRVTPPLAPVAAGWNLIGPFDTPVATANISSDPAGIVMTDFFGYGSAGYEIAASLDPGRGYWVRASAPGTLDLSETPTAARLAALKASGAKQTDPLADAARLSFEDAEGQHRTLYLVPADSAGTEPAAGAFLLPPVPPEGVFDARYTDDRYASPAADGAWEVLLSGATYPLDLRLEGLGYALHVTDGLGGEVLDAVLPDEGTLHVEAPLTQLLLSATSATGAEDDALPLVYALAQSYPNPTTGRATIKYDLPAPQQVRIEVYDVLGRRIAVLVDEEVEAGFHTAVFDASRLASGTYLYRIEAGSFTDVRRMLVIR